MRSSGLRWCPYCHQKWPGSVYHDLRSGRWLDPLPRHVTVSNGDLFFHDGYHGTDRFLLLETKMPWEELQGGQQELLVAVARQPQWTVRVLRGRLPNVTLHRVTRDGVERPVSVPIKGIQTSVVDWLNGQRWDDPRALPGAKPMGTPLTAPRPCPACFEEHPVGTTCAGGWAPWDGESVA